MESKFDLALELLQRLLHLPVAVVPADIPLSKLVEQTPDLESFLGTPQVLQATLHTIPVGDILCLHNRQGALCTAFRLPPQMVVLGPYQDSSQPSVLSIEDPGIQSQISQSDIYTAAHILLSALGLPETPRIFHLYQEQLSRATMPSPDVDKEAPPLWITQEALLRQYVANGQTVQALDLVKKLMSFHRGSALSTRSQALVQAVFLASTAYTAAVLVHGVSAPAHYIVQKFQFYAMQARTVSQLQRVLCEAITHFCSFVRQENASGIGTLYAKVQPYIWDHLDSRLSVPSIAQAMGISAGHLSRQFRAESGISLVQYIRIKRMERAAILLRYTTLPVGDIAERVGYLDGSYFARHFRQSYKCTPLDYRQHCLDGKLSLQQT